LIYTKTPRLGTNSSISLEWILLMKQILFDRLRGLWHTTQKG
jgi:hypothetical protein